MWAKVTAFILLVIFIIATVLSALGAAAIIALGVYYQDIESVKSTYIYRGRSPGWREMLYTYDDLGVDGLDDLFSEYLMCYVKIENATTGKVIVEYGEENHNYRVESDSFRCEIYSYNGGEDYALDDTIKVTRHYDFSPENLETNTMLYIVDKAIDAAYVMKFWIYPIALSCLVIAIALFVFLMRSSGRREGCDGVRAGWGTKVPFDLLFAATVVAVSFILNTAFGNWWWIYSYPIIQKYIINPYYEQRGEINPELLGEVETEHDPESEDVLFEDMGGKEKPLVSKKAPKAKDRKTGSGGKSGNHKGKVIS